MASSVNVKVAVRCRPLSGSEEARGAECVVAIENPSVEITNPDPEAQPPTRAFTYDHSYFMDSTQQQVYEDLGRPTVEKAFDGFNGTIFAYGQTGSGKTYTMMGAEGDAGLVPLMNEEVFRRIEAAQTDELRFLVTVSYLEIYNEVIHDLLNPSESKQLKIREHPKLGIYVEELAELVVRSSDEVLALLEQGNTVRKVAATQMNAHSSRSHSCFTIKLEQKRTEEDGEVTRTTSLTAKINLVDLAGSERASKTGATGDQLREGAAINKSLSALGNVINALTDPKRKKQHIPYRNSKLTRLLQESLGGNALTVMVAAISPADYNYDESMSTLQFAQRAKSIKNETKRNEDVNQRVIRELKDEIEALRAQLESGVGAAGASADGAPSAEAEALKEQIAHLMQEQQQSWEERERMSQQLEEERKSAMSGVTSALETMKQDKREALKRIKRLQQDKAQVTKRMKASKERYAQLKNSLQADMQRYQTIQESEDRTEEQEDDLAELLSHISDKRERLVGLRNDLGQLKGRHKALEEDLTDLRADIAAHAAILEEDAELRRAIAEEERAKMEAEKEAYLERALEEAREAMEAQRKEHEAYYRERLDSLKAKSDDGAAAALVGAQHELEDLRAQVKAMRSENDHLRREQKSAKADQLAAIRDLTEVFESEHTRLQHTVVEGQHLLRQAMADIQYLTRRNAELERQVRAAHAWEPECR